MQSLQLHFRQRVCKNICHLRAACRLLQVCKVLRAEDTAEYSIGQVGIPPVVALLLVKYISVAHVNAVGDSRHFDHLGQRDAVVRCKASVTAARHDAELDSLTDNALLLRAVPLAFVHIRIAGIRREKREIVHGGRAGCAVRCLAGTLPLIWSCRGSLLGRVNCQHCRQIACRNCVLLFLRKGERLDGNARAAARGRFFDRKGHSKERSVLFHILRVDGRNIADQRAGVLPVDVLQIHNSHAAAEVRAFCCRTVRK